MGKIAMTMLAWLLLGSIAWPQTELDTAATAENSLKLTHVIVALQAGTPWLSMRLDAFCALTPVDKTWDGGRVEQEISPYAASFKTELEGAGYKIVTQGETNLFDDNLGAADYGRYPRTRDSSAVVFGAIPVRGLPAIPSGSIGPNRPCFNVGSQR